MIKKYIFVIHILSVLFILPACTARQTVSVTPTLLSPNDFTKLYDPLNHETVSLLSEAKLLSSPELDSPLFKLGYISEDNIVVGVYQERGTLVGWKVDTEDIVFTHALGIVTSKDLVFVAGAKKLVGATERNFKRDIHDQNIEYINGIALWDVYTGGVIDCITYPCQGNTNPRDGFLGSSVDVNGIWNATYWEGSISLLNLSDKSINLYYDINPEDASYQWQIGSVVFDSVNERYAIIFQEARIYVSDIKRPLGYHEIAEGVKGDVTMISDAQIDPTGNWLVVARGSEARVFDLDNGDVLLQIDVADPVLAFDRTGELLFVGANDKLLIYSIANGAKVSEYDALGITSLAVSEDNRLVIWGDVQGKIHVLGKPAQ